MSGLNTVVQWYAEGHIELFDLLEYCEKTGMTQRSQEKIVKRAKYARETKVARVKREQEARQNQNQDETL